MRMADQVDDAGLNDRLREDGIDRLRKALQAVDDGDQNVLDAAVLQLVHDAQPEFGALGLLDPDAEDLLGAVRQDAERDVDRLVAHEAFVADLDPDGVEEHQRIAEIERPVLPFRHLVQHRVGDRRDQVGRDVDAVELLEMAADLANRHAARIHRDDLLVEVRETGAGIWRSASDRRSRPDRAAPTASSSRCRSEPTSSNSRCDDCLCPRRSRHPDARRSRRSESAPTAPSSVRQPAHPC